MTETMTTSSTGGRKGAKPQKHSLLPRAALDAISEVFHYGAEKYTTESASGAHNWRLGYNWSLSYDALQRHLTAFWDGETYDPESGLPHLAHAGCHIMFMLTWLAEQGEGGEFDDRYRMDLASLTDDELLALAYRRPNVKPRPKPRFEYSGDGDWRDRLRERTMQAAHDAGLLYPERTIASTPTGAAAVRRAGSLEPEFRDPTAEPCHCGKPVVYGYDGDPTHTRGMCEKCDAHRCDAYPGACEGKFTGDSDEAKRVQKIIDDTRAAEVRNGWQ